MKHIFVAISLAFLSSSPVLAWDEGEPRAARACHRFSPEEDAQLRDLVAQYRSNWKTIAKNMPGRTARVCNERWTHYLNPTLNKDQWTPAEDQLLIEKIQELGPHWAQIAKFFNGRTYMHIKNRFCFFYRHAIKSACSGLLATPTNVEEQGGVILGDSELWAKLGVEF
jgi:hypothetical protein